MPKRFRPVAGILIALLVILANVALWRDPEVPLEIKRRLTVLNALGWGVVLIPAGLVALWARAHRNRPVVGSGDTDGDR